MSQVHPPRSHAIHSRVRSFSRAGGRLTDAQARALERYGRRYVVEVPRADAIRTVDFYRLGIGACFHVASLCEKHCRDTGGCNEKYK